MVGKVGTAKTCLEKTPSLLTVKSFKRGWSPLQVAAGHNSLGVVEMLLEAGAVCNAADNMAMTPLHSAADVDDATIMEKLTATETGKAAIDLQDEVRARHHARYRARHAHVSSQSTPPRPVSHGSRERTWPRPCGTVAHKPLRALHTCELLMHLASASAYSQKARSHAGVPILPRRTAARRCTTLRTRAERRSSRFCLQLAPRPVSPTERARPRWRSARRNPTAAMGSWPSRSS